MTSTLTYVLEGPRSLKARRQELAPLRPDWVRVRFLYCGLCGSDLSRFEGRRPLRYPVSLGHEFLGVVVEVGNNVPTVAEADIVTSDLNYRCGVCDQCSAGRSHLCREGQVGLFTNRAFAHLADLHWSYLLRLDRAPRMHLALTEPLSCVLHATEWSDVQPQDRVLVVGAGGLGACTAFALCKQSRVLSFEMTDEMPSRLALLERAVAPVGTAVASPEGEYDVVLDLSGSESGLRAACNHVTPGGKLCSLSHLDGESSAGFLLAALARRDVTFKVSYLNGKRETLVTAARLLDEHWDASWEAIIEVVPLDDLQRVFERRHRSPWCKTMVKVSPEAS